MSIIKSKNAVLSRLGKPTVKSVILVAGMLLVVAPADAKGEKSPKGQLSNGYPFTQVDFTSVKITPASFWGQRLKACREVTIPLAFSKCKSEGRYENFVKAAHPSDAYDVGSFMGFPFDDTDVYKTIEGASFLLQTYPDKQLKQYIDSVLDVVAAAQEPDGFSIPHVRSIPRSHIPGRGPRAGLRRRMVHMSFTIWVTWSRLPVPTIVPQGRVSSSILPAVMPIVW